MNSLMECCTYAISHLPNAQMSFLPALLMGVFFSSLLIIQLYRKKSQKSLFDAMKDVFYMMLFSYPDNGHFEFRKCITKGCMKCKNELELKYEIGRKYDSLDSRKISPRIKNAVSNLFSNYEPTQNSNKDEQQPSIIKMDLASNPWWTEYDVYLQEKDLLKLNFDLISKEFKEIYKLFELGKTEGWKLNLNNNGHWCIFPLLTKGIFDERNIIKCPNTAELLSNFPSTMKNCVFGNAFYSILFPDSIISSHYGPSNIRLRCNLSLDVPQKNCWLKVAGQQYPWKAGGFSVYDDSFEHSFYYGPQKLLHKPLVVLVIDLWHPDVTEKEKEVLTEILSPL